MKLNKKLQEIEDCLVNISEKSQIIEDYLGKINKDYFEIYYYRTYDNLIIEDESLLTEVQILEIEVLNIKRFKEHIDTYNYIDSYIKLFLSKMIDPIIDIHTKKLSKKIKKLKTDEIPPYYFYIDGDYVIVLNRREEENRLLEFIRSEKAL